MASFRNVAIVSNFIIFRVSPLVSSSQKCNTTPFVLAGSIRIWTSTFDFQRKPIAISHSTHRKTHQLVKSPQWYFWYGYGSKCSHDQSIINPDECRCGHALTDHGQELLTDLTWPHFHLSPRCLQWKRVLVVWWGSSLTVSFVAEIWFWVVFVVVSVSFLRGSKGVSILGSRIELEGPRSSWNVWFMVGDEEPAPWFRQALFLPWRLVCFGRRALGEARSRDRRTLRRMWWRVEYVCVLVWTCMEYRRTRSTSVEICMHRKGSPFHFTLMLAQMSGIG